MNKNDLKPSDVLIVSLWEQRVADIDEELKEADILMTNIIYYAEKEIE